MTPYMRPTTLGDVAAYTFFGFGGLFIGGETGVLTGGASAGKTISSDPKSRERIETAFRRFRADVLRKEADALDTRRGVMGCDMSLMKHTATEVCGSLDIWNRCFTDLHPLHPNGVGK